jgi:ketol-acid reductoisomerase
MQERSKRPKHAVGSGSYGHRLAQHLTDQGVNVVEVNRPDRAWRRREEE